jgi:hypothetical protein
MFQKLIWLDDRFSTEYDEPEQRALSFVDTGPIIRNADKKHLQHHSSSGIA